jgi:nickel-type superoxide dismutase maturation protease
MQPALRPGDRVLVWRWARPKAGDIIILRDTEAPSRFLVKRVVSADAEALSVRGDNPNVSRDSRHFGRVPRRMVVGRVVYRRGRA